MLGAPPVYADERLRGANDMTTGANEDGFHFRNVSIERDIKVTQWFDLRTVTAGEPCAKCGKPLKIRRAIEVGHVFKLGTKYSEKLNALFLDEAGTAQAVRDGLLRHRRHAHVAGGHRAVQRQGRHHLAVERRAVSGLHHAAERGARTARR